MMTQIGKSIRFWTFLFLISCSPQTIDDLRFEGEMQTKKLALELRAIESKEDLQKAIPTLRKRFDKIANLLIQAKQFPTQESTASNASEELFVELARLYEIPGARELIEQAQRHAVEKLLGSSNQRVSKN